MSDRTYLGDGVYVEFDVVAGGIVLTTSNGLEDTNIIVLEPEVFKALQDWIASRIASRRRLAESGGRGDE